MHFDRYMTRCCADYRVGVVLANSGSGWSVQILCWYAATKYTPRRVVVIHRSSRSSRRETDVWVIDTTRLDSTCVVRPSSGTAHVRPLAVGHHVVSVVSWSFFWLQAPADSRGWWGKIRGSLAYVLQLPTLWRPTLGNFVHKWICRRIEVVGRTRTKGMFRGGGGACSVNTWKYTSEIYTCLFTFLNTPLIERSPIVAFDSWRCFVTTENSKKTGASL